MKRKFFICVCTLVLLVIWSCDYVLDVSPQSGTVTDDQFFKTEDDFESYLIGIYTQMQSGFGDSGSTEWILTANIILQDNHNVGQIAYPLETIMSPTQGRFQAQWTGLYRMITRGNTILGKLPESGLDTDVIKSIEGQTKFLRGFAFLMLARSWGNLPMILTDGYEPSQNVIECSTEEQVWAQVIQDLQQSVDMLPVTWDDANVGRVTKGAALAYLANAYMYIKDWEKAESAAQDLIGLGKYSLLDNVRDVFTELTKNTVESILEVQYKDTSDGQVIWNAQPNNGNILGMFTAPRLIGSEWAPSGGWGEAVGSLELAASFDPNDERRKELIKIAGETYFGESMAEPYIIPLDHIQANSSFTTKYWLGPETTAGVSFLSGNNHQLMRYAEFLLNYAEILFERGKHNEAYEQMNLVRERANLPNIPVSTNRNEFIDALMRERRWELNWEVNLLFHYTRTGTFADFLNDEYGVTMNPAWNKWPIPQGELDQNPNLCQNPGY